LLFESYIECDSVINDFSGDSKYAVSVKIYGWGGDFSEASIHADGDCGGYSIFLHGYTDKVVGSRHGAFVMGYEYDLGLCRNVFQQFPEERYICVVEGRVCLIEDQEGCRTVQEDGEYQCHGGEGLFTSGQ